jgi:vacuolar iron transporter family protein
VSVWSQKDAELADIEKEKEAQARGPESREAELKELQNIYIQRGNHHVLACTAIDLKCLCALLVGH